MHEPFAQADLFVSSRDLGELPASTIVFSYLEISLKILKFKRNYFAYL